MPPPTRRWPVMIGGDETRTAVQRKLCRLPANAPLRTDGHIGSAIGSHGSEQVCGGGVRHTIKHHDWCPNSIVK